jgi:hypothetical protein
VSRRKLDAPKEERTKPLFFSFYRSLPAPLLLPFTFLLVIPEGESAVASTFRPHSDESEEPDLLHPRERELISTGEAQPHAPQEAATIRKSGAQTESEVTDPIAVIFPFADFCPKNACQAPKSSNP